MLIVLDVFSTLFNAFFNGFNGFSIISMVSTGFNGEKIGA